MKTLAHSRQLGATMIEALLTLAITAAMALGLSQVAASNTSSIRLSGVASQLAELRAATDRYVLDNFQALTVTGASHLPFAVPMATLTAGLYLPPAFAATNAYQQTYQVYLHVRSNTVIESLVVTTGGTPLTMTEGGTVALLMKGAGGFVQQGATTAVGANGSWSSLLTTLVPTGSPSPSGNPVAYSIQYIPNGPTGALIRYSTGNAADNKMTTALDMNGNAINNASTVAASLLTVGGVQINTLDAQTLAQLAATGCPAGQALSTSGGTSLYCTTTVPSGMLAAFPNGCPAGWSYYGPAYNRVLVGAGGEYGAGWAGGSDYYTLSIAEMPSHAHHMFTDQEMSDGGLQGYETPNYAGSSPGDPYNYRFGGTYAVGASLGITEYVGGNQAFDNRQPWLSTYYCLKN